MEHTSTTATALADCMCNGTGAIRWTDEGVIGGAVSFVTNGTSLCPCRRSLQPREGVASWWSSEVVFEAKIPAPLNPEFEPIVIRVDAEVPIDAENYRVVLRGNRYWPTLIDLSIGNECSAAMLFPETARAIAAQLIAAADIADSIDNDNPGGFGAGHGGRMTRPAIEALVEALTEDA
jgi:hypothetical protein